MNIISNTNGDHPATNDSPKVIKSFTIDEKNVEWMLENIPEGKQSAFVNALLRRYIKRYENKKAATA